MITYEQALQEILQRVEPMPVVTLPLSQLPGAVIAEPVIASIDSPPFDNSAVDGFGVRLSDVADAGADKPVKLTVRGTIRAGDSPNARLAARTAVRVLTGACVPAAVEAVVMKEFCQEQDGHVLVKTSACAGENIRRRGGEFLRGQEVLAAGKVASPAVVALIASLGYSRFKAYKRPAAAVVTTGNELTKQGRELLPGRIYDSNSHAIRAALGCLGIADVHGLHAAEDASDTKRTFRRALKAADLVVSTGGVSVGEFDFVKEALEQLHVETHVWRIAIKPGKPVYFGVYTEPLLRRRKYVFGLPGNPVSALVTFHLLVVPAIAKMMGCANPADFLTLDARLTRAIKKKGGRMEFVRAKVSTSADGSLVAQPVVGQDSHMLAGLADANALILFPAEAQTLNEGERVKVRLLDWHRL